MGVRTPLVAGNWKLNKNVVEAYHLVSDMIPELELIKSVDKLICPPFTALMAVYSLTRGTSVKLGAQNLFWESKGAYTGEISALMLLEFCTYIILGHSERRTFFSESNDVVSRKVQAALNHGLTPILCVGEKLQENEAGRAAEVVSTQVRESLLGARVINGAQLVIAYEPVWAIGTGRSATAEGANLIVRNVIRPTLTGLFGEKVAQDVRVLYGGSVKVENAAEFFKQPEIDGALVGGASLTAESFVGISKAAQV
jgi:triosephosphate isomerase